MKPKSPYSNGSLNSRVKNMADDSSILRQCLSRASKKKTWWQRNILPLFDDHMKASLVFIVCVIIAALILRYVLNV